MGAPSDDIACGRGSQEGDRLAASFRAPSTKLQLRAPSLQCSALSDHALLHGTRSACPSSVSWRLAGLVRAATSFGHWPAIVQPPSHPRELALCGAFSIPPPSPAPFCISPKGRGPVGASASRGAACDKGPKFCDRRRIRRWQDVACWGAWDLVIVSTSALLTPGTLFSRCIPLVPKFHLAPCPDDSTAPTHNSSV